MLRHDPVCVRPPTAAATSGPTGAPRARDGARGAGESAGLVVTGSRARGCAHGWSDGWLLAWRRDRSGWRALVRYRAGLLQHEHWTDAADVRPRPPAAPAALVDPAPDPQADPPPRRGQAADAPTGVGPSGSPEPARRASTQRRAAVKSASPVPGRRGPAGAPERG